MRRTNTAISAEWGCLYLKAGTGLILAGVMGLLMLLCVPGTGQVASSDVSAAGEVHFEISGSIESIRQDGNDIAVCTGGIYIYQKWQDEDALLEIRARNAVIFYSQKQIFTRLSENRKAEAKEQGPSAKADSKKSPKKRPVAVYLEGDVILQVERYEFASDTRITAERIYYDFGQRNGLVLDATLRMRLPENDLPLYIRAQRIKQWSKDHYGAEKITLSNDEFYKPHFSVKAQKLDIKVQEAAKKDEAKEKTERSYRYDVKNTTINLEDFPIFWWPRGTGTTGKTESPLQALRTSSSSEYGLGIETQWSVPWLLGIPEPSGVDTSLHLDEFTERGPGAGFEMDYTQSGYFGNLRSYIINDNGEDRLGRFESRKDVPIEHPMRGRARWQHRQELPGNLGEGTLEISYLSDRNFLESWREREFDTDKEQETLFYYKKEYNNWAFDVLNKFHLNDFDYTLTELPTAGVHGIGQDLFGVFTYYQDTRISRLAERAGERPVATVLGIEQPSVLPGALDQDDFAFALSRHEITLPLHFGPIHFVPTAIGTYVHDESRLDNHLIYEWPGSLADPRYDQNRKDDDFHQGAAGFRVSSQLWRVDNTVKSRLWDLDRIRHVVIPEVSAFWTGTDSSETTQQHDVFHFAVRQRFQTMRGPEGKKHSVDFLRLNTSVTLVTDDVKDAELPNKFFFTRPEGQFDTPAVLHHDLANLGLARREQFLQNLSDHADTDWTWAISDTTVFTGAINYNIRDAVISQTDSALAVSHSPRSRYYFGHRFLQNGDPFDERALKYNLPVHYRDSHFLTGGASYRINPKYTVALTQQYDVENTSAAYLSATIIRKFPHWFAAFSISHDTTRGGVSFMLSFWPEGYDQFVIGSRRFTRLAP